VEGDPLEDLEADERVIWKWLLKKWDETELTGLIWLIIKTKSELFCTL
jgi:hypothetical protein